VPNLVISGVLRLPLNNFTRLGLNSADLLVYFSHLKQTSATSAHFRFRLGTIQSPESFLGLILVNLVVSGVLRLAFNNFTRLGLTSADILVNFSHLKQTSATSAHVQSTLGTIQSPESYLGLILGRPEAFESALDTFQPSEVNQSYFVTISRTSGSIQQPRVCYSYHLKVA
jgi:hypothetical protein